MRSWKPDEAGIVMERVRLVVKQPTRAEVLKLRGQAFGKTEESVVRELLRRNALLEKMRSDLDKSSGAPTKNQDAQEDP